MGMFLCYLRNVISYKGAYEVWNSPNTVDFIVNYCFTGDVFHEITIFCLRAWFIHRIPSKIYLNYRITPQISLNTEYRNIVRPPYSAMRFWYQWAEYIKRHTTYGPTDISNQGSKQWHGLWVSFENVDLSKKRPRKRNEGPYAFLKLKSNYEN